jgi:diadenosine tetraphosphate (Ap4A) HIT family hydrolase
MAAVDCYTCAQEENLAAAPPSERVHVGEGWRVALAVGASLPGWVVVVPRRHTTRVAEHSPAEARELGTLLVAVSRAVEAVTGTAKTYVMQFAEADGFSHTHFHVTPRSPDADRRGPGVFAYLGQQEALTRAERDELAGRLGGAIRAALAEADGPQRWTEA